MAEPASERTTLRRGPQNAAYERDEILAILDAGIVAHVGVATDDGPIVLPMAYGRDDEQLYLHGAIANAMLRSGRAAEVCVTVTLLDGLIFARNPFHHSMSYRSVVVRGRATLVEDPTRQRHALKLVSDHVAAIWDEQLPPSDAEVRRTQVLAVPLTEASAKVRGFHPRDEEADLASDRWAGTVPVTTTFAAPVPSPDLRAGARQAPTAIAALTDRPAHP